MNGRFVLAFGLLMSALGGGVVLLRPPARPLPASPGQVGLVHVTAEAGLRFGGQVPGPVLRVRAGQAVRLVLENRDAVQHDLWVVQLDERPPFVEPAFPNARTRLVEPGGREEVQFTPTRPGRYRYVCTVPGHEATMYGEFVVE